MTNETSSRQTNSSGKTNSLDSSPSSADAKLKSKAREDARDIKAKARQEGEKVKEEAVSTAKSGLEQGSQRRAEEVDDAAHTVEAVANTLDDQDADGLAAYAHDISKQMSDFASSLSEKSADELAHDARRIARDNPAVFLAGSIVAGFGLARFFKASQPTSRESIDGAAYASSAAGNSTHRESQPEPSSSYATGSGRRVAGARQTPMRTNAAKNTSDRGRNARAYSNGAPRSNS